MYFFSFQQLKVELVDTLNSQLDDLLEGFVSAVEQIEERGDNEARHTQSNM